MDSFELYIFKTNMNYRTVLELDMASLSLYFKISSLNMPMHFQRQNTLAFFIMELLAVQFFTLTTLRKS